MRVLLSVYGSRGDVQPLVALAVRLRDLGAEVEMCVPPDDDYEELLTRARVPVIPVGAPIRSMVPAAPPSAADLPRRAAEFVATQFDSVAAAAAGCDALVATGLALSRPRAIGGRQAGHPLRVRDLLSDRPAVAPSAAAPAAGKAVPSGRDRQPGAVGADRPELQGDVRPGAQPPPRVDRSATGGRRP